MPRNWQSVLSSVPFCKLANLPSSILWISGLRLSMQGYSGPERIRGSCVWTSTKVYMTILSGDNMSRTGEMGEMHCQGFQSFQTHTGSPRQMQQTYQDAMALVTKFGKPEFFLTMTCNPRWPDITNNLRRGQTPLDAPHLVSRVFRQYLKAFVCDLWEEGVLGKAICHIHVIKFQKRGYPHAHLLLTLKQEDRPRNSQDIDSMISAEIPYRVAHPLLWDTVSKMMMHGPCGGDNPQNICMKDGQCSKGFPIPFRGVTDVNVQGYPKYRRRDQAGTVAKSVPGRVDQVHLTNEFVVPYNPYLSQKYNCHINVEACMSIQSIKYLYKYIYKGHDRADVLIHEVWQHDEIGHYLDARYVSPGEAAWHIFSFPMQDKSHTVERLPVHLEGFHQVLFEAGGEGEALARAQGDTKLTGWFAMNRADQNPIHGARQYVNKLYSQINETHAWNKQ